MKTTQYIYVLLTPVLSPLLTAFILRFILTKRGYTGLRLLSRRFSSKRVVQISLPLLSSSIGLVICIQKLISYGIRTDQIVQSIWLISLINSIVVILVNISMIPLSTPDAYDTRSSRWFFWVLRVRKSDLETIRNQHKRLNTSQSHDRGTQSDKPSKPLSREQFLDNFNKDSKQTNNMTSTKSKKFKLPKKDK